MTFSLLLLLQISSVLSIEADDTIAKVLVGNGIHQVEQHTVVTGDGYILQAFRMPNKGAPVVLLQHGILSSAWCWIDNSPEISPAMNLYNLGYDVWMTNNRGNLFSRQHMDFTVDDKEFWDFSFSDLAKYDVPANIKYVLDTTGQKTLTYIGHSQGTSQFFTAMTHPQVKAFVEEKVNLFVALAPVAYLQHQSATLLSVIGNLRLGSMLETVFPYGFLAVDSLGGTNKFFCDATAGTICQISVDITCGESSQDTSEGITNMSAHYPAGTSVKSVDHYEQLMLSGKFCDYDYGKDVNQQRYGSDSPPEFDLSTAQVPTALFIGSHDMLGDPIDARHAAAELPTSTLVYNKEFADYSHETWMVGNSKSFQAWFADLHSLLNKYNPVKAEMIV